VVVVPGKGEVLFNFTLGRSESGTLPKLMATSEGSCDVKLRYKSEGVTLSDVASEIVSLGVSPLTEFHTLLPTTVPKTCIAQFSSPEVAKTFVEYAENDAGIKDLFYIVREMRTILCNRVPMQLAIEELQSLLFPPILGKVDIRKSHREQCKDKEGNPICYTGRVFFTLPVEEFERVKNRIPTSLPWTDGYAKYCVFVNFDGSVQKCHHCLKPGHIERDCPVKSTMNQAQIEVIEQPSLPLSATIIDQQPPAKKMTRNKHKSKRPSYRSTPYKMKNTADSTIEDKREESSGNETDESEEENQTKYDDENVDAEMYLNFCFPEWQKIEKKPVDVWNGTRQAYCWKDENEETLVPVPQFAIPKSARNQEFKHLPMKIVADIVNALHRNMNRIAQHPEFEGKKPLHFEHRQHRYQNGRKQPPYSQQTRLHAHPKYTPEPKDNYLCCKSA